MATKLNLDEIVSRKTDTSKKVSSNSVSVSSDKIKKNEIIDIPIYPQDDDFIQAFKTFLNEQKTTIQEMEDSGFFKETEAYNIIYNLKKSYNVKTDPKTGKDKVIKPQFSWMRAAKLLEYFGYQVKFIFEKIENE